MQFNINVGMSVKGKLFVPITFDILTLRNRWKYKGMGNNRALTFFDIEYDTKPGGFRVALNSVTSVDHHSPTNSQCPPKSIDKPHDLNPRPSSFLPSKVVVPPIRPT